MKDSTDITFDFGIGFKSAPDRIDGEAADRIALGKRSLQYHVGFLDDALRSILPHDLVLLGASTGVGKTQLALAIAAENARAGRHVHYFALEAEERELERRLKFRHLVDVAFDREVRLDGLTYVDWYRGMANASVRGLEREVDEIMRERYATLHTYYRGSKFDHDDIRRLFLAVHEQSDLIILDHLHYVDIDDENENRGFKRTVKMIRDVSLGMGRPVILIAHLRKRDRGAKTIVPDLDDFHGSSEITKICTHAVMLAPAWCMPNSDPSIANTFMHVPKDRRGGATGHVALCQFDRRTNNYRTEYKLGRPTLKGDAWEQVEHAPRWAANHRSYL